jgi:GNAT superfamily N-acetyltransferase
MPDARQIVDRWFSIRLGVSVADLKPGQVAVATCDRRTFAELGYGYVSLLWVVHLGDRAAVSVHPAALAEVSGLAWPRRPDDVMEDDFCQRAGAALRAAVPGSEGGAGGVGVTLYHPGGARPAATDAEVRVITPSDEDRWAGTRMYWRAADHPSAQRGEAFALFLGDQAIAEIITHDPPVAEMAHLVAADGIEVAEEYRGRGYGKALLSHWTCEMQSRGRACLHSTGMDNIASIAVARSVGYLEYARTRSVTFSPPER